MSMLDQVMLDIESGKIKPSSKLNLRNTRLQTKIKLSRIPRLKRELKKRSRLLFFMDIALPFDPFTGTETEEYNADNEWRPPLSATTAALYLKAMASKNDAVKENLMKRAGMEEWDCSDLENITEQDWDIFRFYRKPRIFTIPVVSTADERITGQVYSTDYAISVDRDPITGQIRGDWPVALEVNKFYRDLAYEEMANIDSCITLAKEGKPYELKTDIADFRNADLANITDKDYKEFRKKVYGKILISEDRPSNYLVVAELPLLNSLALKDPENYKIVTPEDINSTLRITRKTAELDEPFANFGSDTWKKHDVHFDFWELDMLCPMTIEDPDNSMLIGKNTRYNIPDSDEKLNKMDFADKFKGAVREALDNATDIEEQFMMSAFVRKMDEKVENKLIQVVAKNDEIKNNPFATMKVIEGNKRLLTLVYGDDEISNLISANELGLDEREAGALDEDKAASQSKVALADILNGGVEEPAEEETVEVVETVKGEATDALDADIISID